MKTIFAERWKFLAAVRPFLLFFAPRGVRRVGIYGMGMNDEGYGIPPLHDLKSFLKVSSTTTKSFTSLPFTSCHLLSPHSLVERNWKIPHTQSCGTFATH